MVLIESTVLTIIFTIIFLLFGNLFLTLLPVFFDLHNLEDLKKYIRKCYHINLKYLTIEDVYELVFISLFLTIGSLNILGGRSYLIFAIGLIGLFYTAYLK
jgi:hypothetical protein